MQVVCLLASNHNKFSFVFDCCFAPFNICRLPWPWDTSLLERRQYRENLGNSPSWRCKLPVSSFVSLLFSLSQAFVLSPVFAGVLPTVLLSFLCHVTNQKFYKTSQINSHIGLWVRDRLEACFSSLFALFCCPDCNRPSRAATAKYPLSSLQNPRESTKTQGKTSVSPLLFLAIPCRNRTDSTQRNFWFCHIVMLKFLVLPRTADFGFAGSSLIIMAFQFFQIFCHAFPSPPNGWYKIYGISFFLLICHSDFPLFQQLAYGNRYYLYIAVLILWLRPPVQ